MPQKVTPVASPKLSGPRYQRESPRSSSLPPHMLVTQPGHLLPALQHSWGRVLGQLGAACQQPVPPRPGSAGRSGRAGETRWLPPTLHWESSAGSFLPSLPGLPAPSPVRRGSGEQERASLGLRGGLSWLCSDKPTSPDTVPAWAEVPRSSVERNICLPTSLLGSFSPRRAEMLFAQQQSGQQHR